MNKALLLGFVAALAISPLAAPAFAAEPFKRSFDGEGSTHWTPPGQQRVIVTGSVTPRAPAEDRRQASGNSGTIVHSFSEMGDHSYRLGHPRS